MNNHDTIKKMLVALIIIIALALGATLVISMFKKDGAPAQNNDEIKSPVTTTQVPEDKVPEKFPAGVPIEEGARITQNYNATTTSGQFQATRAFESKVSAADNLTLYTNWLKTNGWASKSSVDTETYKMVSGSKDKQELQISISENASTKTTTVTISFSQLP